LSEKPAWSNIIITFYHHSVFFLQTTSVTIWSKVHT